MLNIPVAWMTPAGASSTTQFVKLRSWAYPLAVCQSNRKNGTLLLFPLYVPRPLLNETVVFWHCRLFQAGTVALGLAQKLQPASIWQLIKRPPSCEKTL